MSAKREADNFEIRAWLLPKLYDMWSNYWSNVSITISRITKCLLKISFGRKTFVTLFISFETIGNTVKEAINTCVIDVWIMWVSNYKKFKLYTCNWTPTWSRANYMTNRHAGNQSWSRNLLDTIVRLKYNYTNLLYKSQTHSGRSFWKLCCHLLMTSGHLTVL